MGIIKWVYRKEIDIIQDNTFFKHFRAVLNDDMARFVNTSIEDIANLTKIRETAKAWKALNVDHPDSKVSPQYAAGRILDGKLPGKCIKEYENENTVK